MKTIQLTAILVFILSFLGITNLLLASSSDELNNFLQFVEDPESPKIHEKIKTVASPIASMGIDNLSFFYVKISTASLNLNRSVSIICDNGQVCDQMTFGEALDEYFRKKGFNFFKPEINPKTNIISFELTPEFEELLPYLKKMGATSTLRQLPSQDLKNQNQRQFPGYGKCTGFLVSSDLLVTNHHCLSTQDSCEITSFRFNEELKNDLKTVKSIDPYSCKELLITDEDLDFTLVRLAGNPGKKYGYLKLSSRPVRATPYPQHKPADDRGEELLIIGHPASHPYYPGTREIQTVKKVSKPCHSIGSGYEAFSKFDLNALFNDFKLINKAMTGMIKTDCAITGGYSGSPVFDKDLNVIALNSSGTNSWFLYKNIDPSSYVIQTSDILNKYKSQLKALGLIQ